MKNRLQRLRQTVVLTVLALAGLACSRPVSAQERPPVSGLATKRVKFTATHMALADMAAVWAEQTGFSVVIDDEPRRKEADIAADGTAQEILEQIAHTFDYVWKRNARGIILMTKAFHDPNESPQTNLPEMRQMVRQAITALEAFPCSSEARSDMMQARELFRMFSPEQKAQLGAGRRLRTSELPPPQAELVQQIIVNKLFAGAIADWQSLLDMLDGAPVSHVQIQATDRGDLFLYHWLNHRNVNDAALLADLPKEASR